MTALTYQVGGGLPLDAPTYVERQADQDFYDALRRGDYCYVLNSRQMGKTSLRARTMAKLQTDGVACAALDLAEIGTEQLTPTEWYAGLVDLLAEAFQPQMPEFDPGTWWEAQHPLSPVQRFGKFLREELLERVNQPIVIFIDEVDSVLSLGFCHDDFFALVRECYNRRADQPAYRRLTFALLGVATPADLIQDKDRTPFNIGKSIQLTGFTPEEAQPLAEGLAEVVANPQAVLAEILHYTGGQPFLTQKLCDAVVQTTPATESLPTVEPAAIAHLVQTHLVDHWESNDDPPHLRTIQDRIVSNEQRANRLLGLYREIVHQSSIAYDGSPSQVDLRLSGLVVERQNRLEVYNLIYRRVFDADWVAQAFTKLRPYATAIAAWEVSDCKNYSYLLQGDALSEALAWAETRTLGRADYQFLVESQNLGLRQELEEVRQDLLQARCDLDESEHKLKRNQQRTSWLAGLGAMVLALSLLGTVLATSTVKRAKAQEREAKDTAQQAIVESKKARHHQHSAGVILTNLEEKIESQEKQNDELLSQNVNLAEQNAELKDIELQINQQIKITAVASQYALAELEKKEKELSQISIKFNQFETKYNELNSAYVALKQELEHSQKKANNAVISAISGLRLSGEIFLDSGYDIDTVIGQFKFALDLARDFRIAGQEGEVLFRIGEIYESKVKMEEAFSSYQSALSVFNGLRNQNRQSDVLNAIGRIYAKEEKYDAAIRKFHEALEIAYENEYLDGQIDALSNVGGIYAEQGLRRKLFDEFVLGIDYLSESFSIAYDDLSSDEKEKVLKDNDILANMAYLLKEAEEKFGTSENSRQCDEVAEALSVPITELCWWWLSSP